MPALVVRRRFVERIPSLSRHRKSNLLAQSLQFLLQLIDLLLLSVDRAVEFLQQFFAKAQFHFNLGEAGFHRQLNGDRFHVNG